MTDPAAQSDLSLPRWQRTTAIVAIVALVVSVAGAFLSPEQFFRAYLFSYLYWYMAAMGCLGLALLYQMTGGRWGYAARPFFDAGIRTLPLIALGFVPIALGLGHIYAWAEPGYFEGQLHAENREFYLSLPFFFGRAIAYFVIAIGVGLFFTRRITDAAGRPDTRSAPKLGGLSMAAIVLVVSFAVTDWGMSLDPDWYSTLYGSIYIAGGLVSAMSLVAAGVAMVCLRLDRRDEISTIVLHDLGKLLFAFLMVWAYLSFSQFLIIYSGNLPLETFWYHRRLQDGWQWVGASLLLLHFALPFLYLLSRETKRDPRKLARAALFLAAIHWIDLYWNITPSYGDHSVLPHWLDLVLPVALGSILLFEYLRQLRRRLVPILPYWPHGNIEAHAVAEAPHP